MNASRPLDLRRMIYISLFTALIIVGSFLSFPLPLSPVPIVLADFFIMLAALFLGASGAAASVGLFLLLGALGLPVFAGGKSGLAAFVGPTAGFLAGYLVGAVVIGWLAHRGKPSSGKDFLALVSGNIVLYACGAVGLTIILKLSWAKALVAGVVPFMPGLIVKTLVLLLVIPLLRQWFNPASSSQA